MRLFFLILFIILLFPASHVYAEDGIIEGGVQEDDVRTLNSGTEKRFYGAPDAQIMKVSFYYNPDAELNFQLLKQEGQKQYPHLLGYREIDGLYRKALADSHIEEELGMWRYQGGPSPYYFSGAAHLRNTGGAAMTDVKVKFVFEARVGTLKASRASITTDYADLNKNARWQHWITKVVNVNVLPPGEDIIVHTENISFCSFLETLNKKWPDSVRVKVSIQSPQDGQPKNNFGNRAIKVLPDHFVTRVLR